MRATSRAIGTVASCVLASIAAADVVVTDTELVSSQRVGRTTYEYTYRVTAESDEATPISSVTATVSSSSTATTVVDNALDFGTLDPGVPGTSTDTFSFRQNRRTPFDPTALLYQFAFDAPPAPATGGALNDTGVTTCSDFTMDGLDCTTTGAFPRQDGQVGRGGFSFTKLDAAGAPLADQTADYATTPWSCIRDDVTGLIWEVKTETGLRSASADYRLDAPSGRSVSSTCGELTVCSVDAYVDEVNAIRLCGIDDWRVPSRAELFGLVDFGPPTGAAIDAGVFPNVRLIQAYWSDTAAGLSPNRVRTVAFNDGASFEALRVDSLPLRLVHGRKQQ